MENDNFGNIWLTCRIRMDAHAKFVKLDRFSHILLTLYSVSLLGFSIFEPHFSNTPLGPFSAEISIVLSLSILCASLIVWGLGFGNKARDHRDCYLALQRLYGEPSDDSEKKVKYQEILERYPNHSALDYERYLFKKLILEKGNLTTSGGPLKMTFLWACKYIAHELFSKILALLIIASPAIIIGLIYVRP